MCNPERIRKKSSLIIELSILIVIIFCATGYAKERTWVIGYYPLPVGPGFVTRTCKDECKPGVSECYIDDRRKIGGCVSWEDDDPCYEWVLTTCLSLTGDKPFCQELSSNQAICIQCEDECIRSRCIDEHIYQSCIRTKSRPCYFYGRRTSCLEGTVCKEGSCVDTGCEPADDGSLRQFVAVRQEGTNWCWAATIEMIAEYYNLDLEQCEIVNHLYELEEPACCYYYGLCDLYWADTPQDVSNEWEHYGFTKRDLSWSPGLPWNEIKKQIACFSSPIQAFISFGLNYGHVEVVIGYREESDPYVDNQIHACDPLDGACYWVADPDYRSGQGRNWSYSIYDFSRD